MTRVVNIKPPSSPALPLAINNSFLLLLQPSIQKKENTENEQKATEEPKTDKGTPKKKGTK